MGIDPEWMARYQEMLEKGKQAVMDWLECLRIEAAMAEEFDVGGVVLPFERVKTETGIETGDRRVQHIHEWDNIDGYCFCKGKCWNGRHPFGMFDDCETGHKEEE